jgi:diguanylate cyclase (GGDEF)-like protein
MGAPLITENARKMLTALLAEDRSSGESLMARLRELRSIEGLSACSAALQQLAHIELQEDAAERLLLDLLEHRKMLSLSLERDPGLRVAAIDYLANIRKLLETPTIIELSQFELTEQSAITDAVTETYNRRYFQNALEVEMRRCRRYSLQLSLLILDLDFFKSVNDIYGHLIGDLVLKQAGQCIRRVVRESDLACRYGGDEFAVILPETDRLGAHAVAERIRRRVKGTFSSRPIEGKLVSMTVSGGLASYPEDGVEPAVLIEKADQALYLSKSSGKDSIVIYHSERRGSVRYPTRPSARILLAGRPPGDPCPVNAVNLSRGGALLETEADYLPSDIVELTVEEERESWHAPGFVVRVEQEGVRPGPRLVAIAFDNPLPDSCLERSVVHISRPSIVEGSRA